MQDLFDRLTREVGVSPPQARAGTGLLMRMCREKLSDEDFRHVADRLEGWQEVLEGAPELPQKPGGLLGGLAGALANEKLEVISRLTTGFREQGMNQVTAKRFGETVLGYLEERAGDQVRAVQEKLGL